MFDITIINLNAGSYLCMTPKNDLIHAEKDKKDLHLQACLECKRSFTAMVYSSEKTPKAEALAVQKGISALLSINLKKEYFELCGFMREKISIVIVRSNTLLLRGPWYNEAHIHQEMELLDGVVMVLLEPLQR